MEGIEPQRIEDIEEARIAALAEKPVRDLAREEGVDEETKEVFDRRAVQRGEKALGDLREKNESMSGLVNPELAKLKENIAELNKQMEIEFGEEYQGRMIIPTLSSIGRNEKGELEEIKVNGLIGELERDQYTGIGALGKKLEKQAIGAHKSGDRSDQYILDAYRYDPEARELIDRFIDLNKQFGVQRESIKEIKWEKEKSYDSPENINAFIERIGVSKRIPSELNPGSFRSDVDTALREKNYEKVDDLCRKLGFAFSVFDGLKISKEMDEDFGIDLDVIQDKLRKMGDLIRFSGISMGYPKDSITKFEKLLETSETGTNFVKYKNRFLYTVE